MVRTADHLARRRQITDAVRTVALADGLGRVTVAKVAAAGQVSVGHVQHYYDSKQLLLADTIGHVHHDVLDRIDRAVARAERRHARIEQMMGAALEQLLPLDRRRRDETYLRLAFSGLALDDPALAVHQRTFDDALLERATRAVRNGMVCGEVSDDTDSLLAGTTALALTHGLAVRLMHHDSAAERRNARVLVQAQMADIFPGPCARETA